MYNMEKSIHNTVESYINSFQGEIRTKLEILRQLILKTDPSIEESISYGMPAYKLNKKPLAYFAAYEKHIGFYATPNTHESFLHELKNYKQGKGSVQFPNSEELPLELIEKMILFRKELIRNEK